MLEKNLPTQSASEPNPSLKEDNIYKERDGWLERLPGDESLFVKYFIHRIADFSKGNYPNFFQNCGLYAVGSSVNIEGHEKGSHNDIDIVLAGLDFRAVIDYDGVFLMDPETLIEREVVTLPKFFQVLDRGENGEPTVLKPAGQTEEEGYGHHGITYKGVDYDYNPYTFTTPDGNLEGFCLNSAGSSNLVKSLHEALKADDKIGCDNYELPFGQYRYGNGGDKYFITMRFTINPRDSTQETALTTDDDSNGVIDKTPIDFNIHAENLHAESWEDCHRTNGRPHICLYKWPGDRESTRPVLTQIRLPDFLDPEGSERVKRVYFTHGIKDPPTSSRLP